MTPNWRVGIEVELLAPRGRSRLDLAIRIARAHGGSIRRFFHPQSEPSEVADKPSFENLTPGFEVRDAEGRTVACLVDDLTLQHGLDRAAPAQPGWHRIVTDDGRLLRLIDRHCGPDASLDQVLLPIATLFGTTAQRHPSGMVRISDDRGISVAIAAPLPGQRERGCEIVTPPLSDDQPGALAGLLDAARGEGFTLPREGATHIHFDAAPLLSAATVARLVTILVVHGTTLKRLAGTNPHCLRLGAWPDALHAVVAQPGFAALDWVAARQALATVGLEKFCDFNLLNVATASAAKHTFEVRVLPASLDAGDIIAAAELFAAVLTWCVDPHDRSARLPDTLPDLIAVLPLPPHARKLWHDRLFLAACAQVNAPRWPHAPFGAALQDDDAKLVQI